MFNRLPFELQTYIYTGIPDELFIYLPLFTLLLVIFLWRYRCYVLLLSYCTLVLCQTVIFRYTSDSVPYNIFPFKKVGDLVKGRIEVCWEVGLNILMFIPIGILLAYIIRKEKWKNVIALGALMSLSIEMLQFVLKRGMYETDDVIANSIGCGIGAAIVFALCKNKN